MSREKELIREYIKIILESESDGPTTFGDYSGGGMFGGSAGGAGSTRSALVSPISDVLKIVKGKIKELFAGVKYITTFALKTALSVLTLGLYDAKYDQIHQSYVSSMSKIRSQYAQAVSDSIQAFLKNDLSTIAFFYNPGLYMLGRGGMSVAESRMIFEDAEESKKSIKAGSNASKVTIDEYFAGLYESLRNLASAKTLDDLTLDDKTYAELRKNLDSVVDENERMTAEKELVRTAKLQIFTDEMKKLKSEREIMMKGLKEAGVPLDVIMDPTGLVSRYEREMRKLASLSDSM